MTSWFPPNESESEWLVKYSEESNSKFWSVKKSTLSLSLRQDWGSTKNREREGRENVGLKRENIRTFSLFIYKQFSEFEWSTLGGYSIEDRSVLCFDTESWT